MKIQRLFSGCLALAMLLTACTQHKEQDSTDASSETIRQTQAETQAATQPASQEIEDTELITNRDREGSYDESKAAVIRLNGSSAACDSNAVQISGSTVTITDEGTYILSGTLDDGMIIVNAEKKDKTQLVLNGVTIHSETSAPIYVLQADKVFVTLAEGTENVLSNGGTYTAIDENNIDAVIFSKEDLTLNGSGSLTVTSPAGHGVVSKDELTVAGGSYEINCASHGLAGKDNVCIANASLNITAGKDGIHGENADDAALGFVYIESGSFMISAEGDGISSAAYMHIQGGSFNIITGGGSVNAEKQTSDSWGGFMGGVGRGKGGPGGGSFGGSTASNSEEDSTSIKGLKAAGDLTINDGSFIIDAADDAVHSNASVTVNGGTFEIATGDDGFHADETLTVTAGTVNISESYEGLEGLHVEVSGGDITLKASDDGINAAGGTDESGFGGQRGNDMFGGGMGGSASNGSILISGGTVYINASGDGLDANGTLTISGGYITVCGPTSGDTATLDYDISGVIIGGTFIGTGASQMAQTFSDSEQGVVAVSVGNQSAGTQITLADASGNVLISHAPELSFAVVILSSPEIVKGETYTITVGSASGEFGAS